MYISRSEIIRLISNQTSVHRMFDLKSQESLRFQSKVAINEVQLPLYHIYFELQTSVAQYNNFFGCSGILLIQCNELVCKKLQNLSLISCNLIDFFKQALKFVWLLSQSVCRDHSQVISIWM